MEKMYLKEFETHFPFIGKAIEQGNRVSILNDNTGKPFATIIPYVPKKSTKRKIGLLDGKINIEFKDNFEMTTEELLALQ